jgi:putative protein-disulfide isomerase
MAGVRTQGTEMPETEAGIEFVYFADPMCSWCYGFAPVIEAIGERFGEAVPIRLVMGGLRAGNTRPMRPADKDYIRDAWTRVAQASGQPFDFAFLDRDGFVYDTEPACRAVVTVRDLTPQRPALLFMHALQRAFYAEGRDITAPDEIVRVAGELGLEPDSFRQLFLSSEARLATVGDFRFAQEAGATGFPTLLMGSAAGGYVLVTSGFQPQQVILPALERWWRGAQAQADQRG